MSLAVEIEPRERAPQAKLTADGWLRRHASARPDAPALADPQGSHGRPGRTFTYAQAETCVDALAGVFASLGLAPGDRIAVQLANTALAPLTLLAAWRAGLTVIALPFLWRRYEVATIAADLKPQVLLGAGSFDGFSIAHGLREVAAKEMSVRFVLGFGADLPDGVAPLDALLDLKRSVVTPAEPRDLPGAALVTFTARAGAAFVPLAYTEDELLAHGTSAAQTLSLDRDETILNPFPMSSAAGIGFALLPWLVSGCTLLQHEPFDLDAFAAQLIEQGATLAALPAPLIAAFAATGVTTDARCKLGRMGQVWSPAQAAGGSAANLPLFDIHPRDDGSLPELSLGTTNASPPERDPELLHHGGFAIAASELDALYKPIPASSMPPALPCPARSWATASTPPWWRSRHNPSPARRSAPSSPGRAWRRINIRSGWW